MLEEIGNLLLQTFALPNGFLGGFARRPPTLQGWFAGCQTFAYLGYGTQDRLGEFLDDVELADLVRNSAENRAQRLRIQRRRIGGDPTQRQAALLQMRLETPQERGDVFVVRIVVEHMVDQAFERAIIDDGQDAKWPIVQLVDGDIAGEISEGPMEIGSVHLAGRLFPPQPPPSLDGCVRDENPVVAPQVPTGRLIRQAILDHEPNGPPR